MKANSSTYIWPPRAETRIPKEEGIILYGDLDWIGQFKFNDSRCLIKILEDGTIELWNRHGEKFRDYHAPDWLLEQIRIAVNEFELGSGWHLLDGGLLDKKHRRIKDTIVIWDVLVKNGEHLVDTTYKGRYQLLNPFGSVVSRRWDQEDHCWFCDNVPFGERITDNVFVPRIIYKNDWNDAWATIDKVNKPFLDAGIGPLLEGLVYKDPDGILELGWQAKNNSHWMSRSRVETGRHQF